MKLRKTKSLIVACLRPGPGIQVDTRSIKRVVLPDAPPPSSSGRANLDAGKRGNIIAVVGAEVKRRIERAVDLVLGRARTRATEKPYPWA
jgi:hypothetical protein